MTIFGDHIYVLADRWRQDMQDPGNRRDAYVVVFRTDGTFVNEYPALNFSSGLHEVGAGMASFQPNFFVSPTPPAKLYVAGTTTLAGGQTIVTVVRFSRNGNGTLVRDTDLGANGNQTYLDHTVPDSQCNANARPCRIVANGLALTTEMAGLIRVVKRV